MPQKESQLKLGKTISGIALSSGMEVNLILAYGQN